MTILTHVLKSDAYEQILTEIRYSVATARANEKELISIKFNTDNNDSSKVLPAIIRALKKIKKEGRIDFFVSAEDFLSGNAETSYLLNRFPDIIGELEDEKSNFIVKV